MFLKKIVYIIMISLCLISVSTSYTYCAESSLVLEKISGDLLFDIVGDYNANGNNQIIALIEDEDGEGGTFYTLDKNGNIDYTKHYETNSEIFDSNEFKIMSFPSPDIKEYPAFKLIEDTNPSNTGKYAVFKYTSADDTGTKITEYKYFNPSGGYDSYIYSNPEFDEQVLGLVIDGTPKLVEYIDGNGNILIPASSGFVANSSNRAEVFNYEYSSILVRDDSRKNWIS